MRNLFRRLGVFLGLMAMSQPQMSHQSASGNIIPQKHHRGSPGRFKSRKLASKRPASFYKDRRKKRKLSRTMRRYNLKRAA